MDFLIVGRFRAMSTPSSLGAGAKCKIIARLEFTKDNVKRRCEIFLSWLNQMRRHAAKAAAQRNALRATSLCRT